MTAVGSGVVGLGACGVVMEAGLREGGSVMYWYGMLDGNVAVL